MNSAAVFATLPRTFAALLCALALVAITPSDAMAQEPAGETAFANNGPETDSGFHLAANMGVSKFFNGGRTAFGLDVFPGFALGNGLVLEGQVGIHVGGRGLRNFYFNYDGLSGRNGIGRTTYVPLLFGARYKMDFGPVQAFASSHLGPALTGNFNPNACNNGDCNALRFAFNVGSGAEYMVTEQIGVGAAFWYHLLAGSNGVVSMLNFGAHASFQF